MVALCVCVYEWRIVAWTEVQLSTAKSKKKEKNDDERCESSWSNQCAPAAVGNFATTISISSSSSSIDLLIVLLLLLWARSSRPTAATVRNSSKYLTLPTHDRMLMKVEGGRWTLVWFSPYRRSESRRVAVEVQYSTVQYVSTLAQCCVVSSWDDDDGVDVRHQFPSGSSCNHRVRPSSTA